MNPQINLTGAKLRRMLLVTALVVCPLLATKSGRAQAVVTATLTGSDGTSVVNITSNQSFTLTLMISTNFPSNAITYFFRSNPAGSGLFRIVSRDASASPYPTPELICFGDACLLNPVNDFDLGAGNNGSDITPPGMYTIAVYTFNTENAPLGQYTISTDRGIVTDRTGGGFQDVPFFASATINVVPEPTTLGLALLGGAALSVIVWRRQRRRA